MPETRRMLVVDDEFGICEVLKQFFGPRGFTVDVAFSGEEALAKLTRDPIDILLLDILLPGLSGIEVLRRAKAEHPGLRVVMITALDQEHLVSQATRHGAAGFLAKPFNFNDAVWSSSLFSSPA